MNVVDGVPLLGLIDAAHVGGGAEPSGLTAASPANGEPSGGAAPPSASPPAVEQAANEHASTTTVVTTLAYMS